LVSKHRESHFRLWLSCLSLFAVPHQSFLTYAWHWEHRHAFVHDPDCDQTRIKNRTPVKEPASNPQRLQTASSCGSCSSSLRCWLQYIGTSLVANWWTMVCDQTSRFPWLRVCQGMCCVFLCPTREVIRCCLFVDWVKDWGKWCSSCRTTNYETN
jgi:hypothetical protein